MQAALAVLALDGAADGDGLFGANFPAVQREDAFAEILSSCRGEAAFPGDVFAFGGAELVVGSWLSGCAGEVFVGGFIASTVGEKVSRWGEGSFDGFVTGSVALGWEGNLDEFGGLGADFGIGRGGGECP